MEWTEEAIARLRGFWAEGHSTAEIGRRMAVSKNAIVGKAHRLELPARPSPIRHEASGAPRRRAPPSRVVGPTLPSLAASPIPAAPCPGVPQAAPPAVRESAEARPQPIGRARAGWDPGTSRPGGRQITCCWPIGEPGTPSFRFCEATALTGKPYCDEHAQIAYVRVRDRRDDAA